MNSDSSTVLVDGELQNHTQPAITVTSRGLMYGDGCFETLCATGGHFFMLHAHLERLKQGLAYLEIDYPPDLKADNIRPRLKGLLQENNLYEEKAIIRMQVWRAGGRGYRTGPLKGSHYGVTATPRPEPPARYRLATVATRRIPSSALPAAYKLTNGINFIKAAREARKKGADDALMETINGMVSETTVANIFWLQGATVYTPSRECDILPGISRHIILDLLGRKFNVSVEKGCYSIEALQQAETVWICNSVKDIAAVTQIDQARYPLEHPFLKRLQTAFYSYKAEHINKNL